MLVFWVILVNLTAIDWLVKWFSSNFNVWIYFLDLILHLEQIDIFFFHQVNGLMFGENLITPVMVLLSSSLFWLLVGLGVAGWVFRFSPALTKKYVVWVLVALGSSDLVTYRILKPLFARDRPCYHLMDAVLRVDSCGGQLGFPSNHAANAMAVTCVLLLFYSGSRKKYLLLLVPLLIGISRIYLGVHYPLDVIAGFVVGAGIAFIIYFLVSKWTKPQTNGS